MKFFAQLIVFTVLPMTFLACNKKSPEKTPLETIHQEIQSIENDSQQLRQKNGESGLKTTTPATEYTNEFLSQFCTIIDKKTAQQDVLKYFSPSSDILKSYQLVSQIANAVTDCEFVEAKFYDHPFDLAEYKTDKGFVYIQVTYDKNFKVKSFIPLVFADPIEFKMNKVLTRDNVSLTTYTIYKKSLTDKIGSVFLRTPYMVQGSYIAYAQLALHYNKALVLQANRGSHTSGGDFKWLEKGNIQDSYDSIEWISQQSFSNGKVVAYGVSYDGFDALASAASNHPALKSVIACSAPANAATDSFTSNRFIENGIFSYVTTDRKEESINKIDDIWEFIQTDISSKSRLKMDDILLGLDYEEWNITNEAIDDLNHPYWSERQLLEELNFAKMPIAHIAGLKQDQDGRDTILAFKSIQKNSLFKNQNYLILHKDGHGCGDSYNLDIYNDMIALTNTDSSQVDLTKNKKYNRFNFLTNGYASADEENELPITTATLELPQSTVVTDYGYSRNPDPNLYEKTIELEIPNAITLNGAPQMKLSYKASAPEVPVHIYFIFLTPQGQAISFTTGFRSGFISQKINTIESVELTFPLVNAKIPAGSKMQIYISTHDKAIFYRQPLIRQQFIAGNFFEPEIEIVNDGVNQSAIALPIEKDMTEEPPIATPLQLTRAQ